MLNENKMMAFSQACLTSLVYNSFSSFIQLFFLAPADSFSVFHLTKHTSLFYSLLITHHLTSFLQADAMHTIRVLRFDPRWSCAPQKAHRESKLHHIQPIYFPTPPNPCPASHTVTALVALGNLWEATDRSHSAMACIPRPGSDTFLPPPFLIGINMQNKYHHRHRQLYSAGTWCFTSHNFTAGYSLRHHTFTNDSTICPCHAMPACLYTWEHILTQCPLHSSPRQCYFGNQASMDYILGTEDGGKGFVKFVNETGVFLRPLPPRPDPP